MTTQMSERTWRTWTAFRGGVGLHIFMRRCPRRKGSFSRGRPKPAFKSLSNACRKSVVEQREIHALRLPDVSEGLSRKSRQARHDEILGERGRAVERNPHQAVGSGGKDEFLMPIDLTWHRCTYAVWTATRPSCLNLHGIRAFGTAASGEVHTPSQQHGVGRCYATATLLELASCSTCVRRTSMSNGIGRTRSAPDPTSASC